MATRMQQRRGTAAQWTAADPVLAAGEMGFETDTNEFRIGDGVNVWSDLSPFKNLEDLGGSLDDYVPVSTKGQINGVAPLNANGQIPIAFLAELIDDAPAALNTLGEIADLLTAVESSVSSSISAHSSDTTNIHGIADTSVLATEQDITDAVNTAAADADTKISAHSSDTTDVHGILDTALLATTQDVLTSQTAAENFATGAVTDHNNLTENVHGIADTAALVTTTAMATAITNHNDDTTSVHGIADTSVLETVTGSQDKADAAEAAAISASGTAADGKVSDHNLDTTNVHGIADTANLVYTSDSRLSDVRTPADLSVTTGKIADAAVTGVKIADNAISQSHLGDDSVGTNEIGGLAVTTAKIADEAVTTAKIATGAVTKSMVGLGNADNTADADKPVSTATQTALDLKAPKAAPTFTGTLTAADITVTGNLTVEGTTTTISTANFTTEDALIYLGEGNSANLVDLGFVASFNDGTYQHTGLVKDSSDNKWKLFKGVTDEPTTTVNFAQGSLDALKVGAFEATTVTPSSGVVFSDGTQTKVGVPSITTIATGLTAGANTIAAGEQDKFVPLTGAVVITLPATGYSTGQSIDFYQASGTGAYFASTNGVVGTPGLKFRTTYSVVTAMKISGGWLVFGDLSL